VVKMSNPNNRVEILKKTVGNNPFYKIVVNQKEYQCRFLYVVPLIRATEFPVTRHGRKIRIIFRLVSAGGAIVIDNYSTTETVSKKKDSLTGGMVTTKQDTDYIGFEAVSAILRREGMGYKKLGTVTAKDIEELARKAIQNDVAKPLTSDGSIVRIDVCGSHLLDRRPEKTDEDFWTLYIPSKMLPMHEAVLRKIKEKGYTYKTEEIDHIIEILSSFAG